MATIITTDDHTAPTRRPTGLLKLLACLCVMAVVALVGYIYGPRLFARLTSAPTILIATPTAGGSGTQARPTPLPYQPRIDPVAAPVLTLDQINATSIAIYQATAQAAEPQPNVDRLPADAPPVEYGSRVNTIAPAGENVSVNVTSDQTGTKQKEPINIQETKTCLHGQVWTDSGCHRPTPAP
jgi:hypothetical protein